MGYCTIILAFIETLKENPDGISEKDLVSVLIEKIPRLNNRKRFNQFSFDNIIGRNELSGNLEPEEALIKCFKIKNNKFYFNKTDTYTNLLNILSNPSEGCDYETEVIEYFEGKSASLLERGILAEQLSRYSELKGITNTDYLRMFAHMYANVKGK